MAPQQDRGLGERIADTLMLLMVIAVFGVSSMALTAFGVKYDVAGGSLLQKVHPASYLAAAALAARFVARRDRLSWIAGLPARFPGAAYFAAIWIVMFVFASTVQHVPVTPLIDTFLCAFVFLILYSDADEGARRNVRRALHALVFVNACIGIGEYVTHMRLTPFVAGGVAITNDYRSTALFGHPLINSALSAAYILMLYFGGDRSIGPIARTALIGLQAAALVTFAGRTAIVLCAALVLIGSLRPAARLLIGGRFDMRVAMFALALAPLALTLVAALAQQGDFDMLLDRFSDDKGSAQARVVMFQLFDYFSPDEILFGPDQERLASIQRTLGIQYGIENSWLGFVFQYGALMAVFFSAAFGALLWEFWRRSKAGATALVLYFLILLTSATGISVKSLIFDQFGIMLLAIFGPAQRQASESRARWIAPRLAPER